MPAKGIQDPTGKAKPNSYIFIGPPRAGKTVFFATAIGALQHVCSQNARDFMLTNETHASLEFVDGVLGKLGDSRWPENTAGRGIYEFRLVRKRFCWVFERTDFLCYHDYGGEVFEQAFCDPKRLRVEPGLAGQVQQLTEEIAGAKGVFLLVDAAGLVDGKSVQLRDSLFFLTDLLAKCRTRQGPKVAVIFSKKDALADVPAFDPVEVFRDQHQDAWLKLAGLNARYFYLSAVGQADTDPDGNLVPPAGFKPHMADGVLETMGWMLGIRVSAREQRGNRLAKTEETTEGDSGKTPGQSEARP